MNDIDIENVLKAAGQRDRPPEDIERQVREHLRIEWLSIAAEVRAQRQRRIGFALAAGLAATALAVWLAGPPVAVGESVAMIALTSGKIQAKTGWPRSWRVIGDGEALVAGESLATGPGGHVAVSLPGGVSARLGDNTRIKVKSADKVQIKHGALYVDAGRATPGRASLRVVTPAGTIRHVGTQYEVRVIGSRVLVRVREGKIEWKNASGAAASAGAGEQLVIGPDGVVKRGPIERFGDSWDWVEAAAPGIDIDGRPLADVLAWAGRELGRDIVFADADVESEATRIVVHGSITGLTPMQALDAVLATTQLRSAVVDGRIVVGRQEPGRQPSVTSSSANPTT